MTMETTKYAEFLLECINIRVWPLLGSERIIPIGLV